MDICSVTSYPFGFYQIKKHLIIYTINLLVSTSRNKYKKASSVQVKKYGALEIYFKFMRACHEMNGIVHTSVGHTPYVNGKSEPQIKIWKILQDNF